MPATPISQILKPLASLRLTVVLIVLAMILIYAGTWAQIDNGIWTVQKKYFHSFFTWIDFQTFLPRPVPGERGIPGGFPFPGGYTIGLTLLINLLVAHGLRFKQTWRDVILLPLLALMLAPLVMWENKGVNWLAEFIQRIGISLPGTTIPLFVWVVALSVLVGTPFFAAVFFLHGKRGGVILIHLGLLLLLVGEGITSAYQVESRMMIDEGGYANYSQDIRSPELAIVDTSAADANQHTVIHASALRKGNSVSDTKLPFDVKIEEFLGNSDILGPMQARQSGQTSPLSIKANSGRFASVTVVPAAAAPGTDDRVDMPSAYVTLSDKSGHSLGTYLVSAGLEAQQVTVGGKNYDLQLRFKRLYKPYTMHLIDFVHDQYTGTTVPKDFSSHVRLIDPSRKEQREVRIWMNNPLRYNGETFYQAGFQPGDKTTILQVVSNPGVVLPYAACAIGAIGLLSHFCMMLARFLRKDIRATARTAKTPEKSDAKVRRHEPRRWWNGEVVFPTAVLLVGVICVLRMSVQRAQGPAGFDFSTAGRLPISYEGRTLPLDSLARHSIKSMCGKESVYDDKSEKVPPLRFLMELFSRDAAARKYKLFRIDHPDVKTLLNLDRDQRYFALDDLLPAGAKLDEQFNAAQDVPKAQRSKYHLAILDLARRLSIFTRLSDVGTLHVQTPIKPGDPWRTLAEAARATDGDVTKMTGSSAAFYNMVEAYQEHDASRFKTAANSYDNAIAQAFPKVSSKAAFERWYNQLSPFFLAAVFYVFVFLLAAVSWLGWSRPFSRGAFWLLILALVVHTVGVVSRVYISGRAPVTNLESSAIFIGWIVVILGIVLELIYRNGVGSVVGAAVGFVTLTIYLNMAQDDTMKVLQAVLDTNFWLWTHVPAITIGYSATFLAGALGIAYVILGLFTRKLTPELGKTLATMIYGVTCFAVIFSFVGTILGGIWADQSWGRFWGWDPKENGAVLIVLANALLLHARWGGLVKQRGIACLAIFGNIVTSWSWFGTNMLGVGLHSYGFMDAALVALLAFVASQVLLIAAANLPLSWWRSPFALPHGATARSSRHQIATTPA